jgi:hypothetical protein
VALLLSPIAANAQATGEWRGRIVVDSTRESLADAEVAILQLRRSVKSDSLGRFVMTGLPTGVYKVVTRAVGFVPDTTMFEIALGESIVQDITLRRAITKVAEVHVKAPTRRYLTGKMVEFEERKERGIGVFLDRDLLAAQRNRKLSDIVASYGRGVDVRRGTRSKAWAVGGRAVGTGRCLLCGSRGQVQLDPADLAAGAKPACYMDVWLDGALVYNGAANGAPLFDLNAINPDDIEAIEVYSGASQLPARFSVTSGGCGALVIWTRA